MNKGLFTSKTDEWETPQDLFDEINKEFDLELDVCATSKNTKLATYFTKMDDGLSQKWQPLKCWMNPPYGREIGKWVKKASESKTLVVALLPARTDTKWFHDYIYNKAEVRFLKGRVKFGGKGPAPFPSMIVIFNPFQKHNCTCQFDKSKIYIPGVVHNKNCPYRIFAPY